MRERAYDFANPKIRILAVNTVRLDDVIPPDEKIELIKLDLKSGEYHALLGAKDILKKRRPVLLFEAGHSSSTHYRVTPAMIFDLLCTGLDYQLSTMGRWLTHTPGFTCNEFIAAFDTDFFFMAYPATAR